VELAEQLNRKFVQAQEMSDTLNETMDTTHASVSEIADSSKMTADAIEQQTSQTSDIQQSIQEVGEQARNMGAISDRTNTTVEEGVVLIDKLKAQAEEVAKINIETRTTTQALNESIKDVQAITETILGISSQTNLLALNASIEAARAGEAGKGFAVVADEIRTLSESTRQATEQISSIIERLTKDAQSAAESMTQSANVAQQQNVLIEETGNKLNDIKTETDELHEGVMQVNGSVQNIISANSMIMDSITNLSATSEEVAASTDTVLSVSDSSMDALKDMNGILGEISAISRQLQIVANNQAD
jgi:methyl-accepting chemotaxis protein